jgi:hydrogenase nickel incorporation protein HypA/HybF
MGPLKGIRLLEFAGIGPGPFCAMIKDTPAEGAKLKIKRVPVIMRCDACGGTIQFDTKEITETRCPNCGSKEYSLVSGKEYYIDKMEVI